MRFTYISIRLRLVLISVFIVIGYCVFAQSEDLII